MAFRKNLSGLLQLGAVLLFANAQAQYPYSAFNEASAAYTALSGVGLNFAAGNPAILGLFPEDQRFALLIEAALDDLNSNVDDIVPDFALQVAMNRRLVFAFSMSRHGAATESQGTRTASPDDFMSPRLSFMSFFNRENWNLGVGYNLKSNLGAGAALRQQEYSLFSAPYDDYLVKQEYWSLDLGLMKNDERLHWGLALRNLAWARTTLQNSEPFVIYSMYPDAIAWGPEQFPGLTFEPKLALEGGIRWLAYSSWELLFDASTRKELALGLRWKTFSQATLSGGIAGRYDRLWSAEPITYGTIGAQFHIHKFAAALTWIVPLEAAADQTVATPIGEFLLSQPRVQRWLFGLAFLL
jgi:hypothetical protein